MPSSWTARTSPSNHCVGGGHAAGPRGGGAPAARDVRALVPPPPRAAARRELLRAAASPSAGDRERAAAAIARHATALAGEERSGACAICLGDLDDAEAPLAAARVACGHAFHVDCLRPWLAHCAREKRALTCPTCRTPVCPVVAPDVEAGDVVPVNSGLE